MTKHTPRLEPMRTRTFLIGILILWLTAGVLAQDDPRTAAMRKVVTATNEKLAEMEQHPEFSSVFAVELTVNKHSAPYPAVGIYQRTATFFYTYGDREKNPYPDRLLKITAVYKRSSRTETAEFYFNSSGQLVFLLWSNAEGSVQESRLYFSGNALVRMTDDGKNVGLRTPHAIEANALARRESSRLTGIFRAALIDND